MDENDSETVICSICGKEVQIINLAELFEVIGKIANPNPKAGYCDAIGEDFVCEECQAKPGVIRWNGMAEA